MNTHFAIGTHILVALEALKQRFGDKPIPTAALSWSAATHKVFILRIVKKLEAHGLVTTIRGPQGGVKLKKPGEKILLSEVYMATQEVQNVYKVHETNSKCQIGNNISDVLEQFQEDLEGSILVEMSKKTIADLTSATLKTSEIKIAKGVTYTNYKDDLAQSI